VIIEFYGVPGCGKSTATDLVEKEYVSKRKIYSSDEIIKEIKEKKLKHYRILGKNTPQKPKISEVLELFMYIKNKKSIFYWFKLWFMIKASYSFFIRSLEIMALYQFCEEKYKDDIIIVHHGIIQNLISFVYINPIQSMERFSKYALNIIDRQVCYIHIGINVDSALIRLRNRKNQHGRLPKIKSDKKLLEVLYFQNGIFYFCDELLNRQDIKDKYLIYNDSDEENFKNMLLETMNKYEETKEKIIIKSKERDQIVEGKSNE